MEFATAFVLALISSLFVAVLTVLTQRFHGHLSHDNHAGVQKLHSAPTPRVGGLALCAGFLVGGLSLSGADQMLWWMLCIAAVPAFLAGLIEDFTKRVSVRTRLLAAIFSGVIFCLLTGYQITQVDLPGADWLLSLSLFSLVFTAFAVSGIVNAVNIIDGVNGLASGTSIIILSGFAAVAWQVDDVQILGACLVAIGALIGFFLLNFPNGRLFLGDAGAYTIGFILAAVAVALPARNPEMSPLIGLLALAYPVMETAVSIIRRIRRKGSHPGQPDRLHLHSLIYRSRALKMAQAIGSPHLRNAMAGLIMMGMPLLSSALMLMAYKSTALVWCSVAVVALTYIVIYRKVALLAPLVSFLKTARAIDGEIPKVNKSA